jgi:two-component system cell cycle sensor histidine kinase/response regulator CckA
MNLAGNARDAMPRGGALEIGVGMTEINEEFRLTRGFGKPGSYAVMTVADTGVGMDNTVRERIFEPFFTTKGTGKGTGLGLSIVFGIVKQHHGYIDVASAPGVGTKFSVYLPLAQTAVIVAEGEHQRDQPRGGDETILVAEDNNEVRSMLVKILRGAGYGVIETVDGDDAVVRFGKEGNSVKLLLCDVIMPNRNGRETYEAIRALKPDIRVLYISGYTADVLNQSGISERDFDFLQKPVQSRDLLRRVRDILDRLQNKGTAGGI